jgi:hypothetical protein
MPVTKRHPIKRLSRGAPLAPSVVKRANAIHLWARIDVPALFALVGVLYRPAQRGFALFALLNPCASSIYKVLTVFPIVAKSHKFEQLAKRL